MPVVPCSGRTGADPNSPTLPYSDTGTFKSDSCGDTDGDAFVIPHPDCDPGPAYTHSGASPINTGASPVCTSYPRRSGYL